MNNSSNNALKWLQLDKDEPSDVFYSCVGAIAASTVLALHLNVPPPCPVSTSRFFLHRLWNSELLYQLRYQLIWATMVVIAPELLVSLAFGDWRAASQGVAVFRKFGSGAVKTWTRTHANFANMGGLRFEMRRGGPDLAASPTRSRDLESKLLMVLLKVYMRQNVPFNWFMVKTQGFWYLVCQKASHWFGRVRNLRKLDKGKGTATSSPGTTTGDTELVDMGAQNDIELPSSLINILFYERIRGDASLARQSRSGVESGVAESSHSAQRESIDLGQLNRLPLDTSSTHMGDENDSHRLGRPADLVQGIRRFCRDGQAHQQSYRPHANYGTISLHLNSVQIIVAQMLGIIDDIPDLDKATINDKSKTNGFIKISAMIPLLWFVARIIAKRCMSQRISQLELASSTYIFCSLLAYVLYWSKPQGVERPIEVPVGLSDTIRPVTDQDVDLLRQMGGSPFLERNFLPPFGMDSQNVHPTQSIPTGTSFTTFAILGFGHGGVLLYDDDLVGTVVGIVFGGLYALGWKSTSFPSIVERLVWRVALVAITGSLIPFSIANGICTMVFRDLKDPGGRKRTHAVHSLSLYGLLGIYVIGRLFMLGGMLREFFA